MHTYTHTHTQSHIRTHIYTHVNTLSLWASLLQKHTHTRTCSNPNHGTASVFSFVLKTFAAAFLVLEGNGLPSGVYVSHKTSKLPDPGLNGSG